MRNGSKMACLVKSLLGHVNILTLILNEALWVDGVQDVVLKP